VQAEHLIKWIISHSTVRRNGCIDLSRG